MRSSVTIRDVAGLADVHPGTVSRALNERTRELVSPDTAERVIRAAEQLGYRPNPIARGLKTNRSFTVGVLIPDLTNPLFPPIMRGIEDRLGDAGYILLTANTDNDPAREQTALHALRARQVDGFIAATARLPGDLLAEVSAAGTPVVLVNRTLGDGSLAAVAVDDRHGIELAVAHVVGLGHERIAHVAGPQNVSTGHRRYLGFRDSMRAAELELPAQRIAFAGAFTESEGAVACEQLFSGDPSITAIVTANDTLALGCYDALEAHGRKCPDDLSIVGFNDMPFVDRLAPPLTTVRIPQREIGALAAELLLEQLAGSTTRSEREILLEPALVVRGSTRAIR